MELEDRYPDEAAEAAWAAQEQEPTLYCYIDDCREVASLVIPSYPDTVRLCSGHAHLHTPEPWETPRSTESAPF